MTMKLTVEASALPVRAQFDDERSPCVGICVTFEYRGCRYCCGCGRTVEEIGEWAGAGRRKREAIRTLAAWRLNNLPIS